MEIQEVQKEELKNKIITIRISESEKKIMEQKNISPSKLFKKALEELD